MMNDYIYKSSEVFNNINKSFDDFCDEARVIEYAKCCLINNQELEDFYVDSIYVYVNKIGNEYYLDYNDVCLKIETVDNLIYDYNRE